MRPIGDLERSCLVSCGQSYPLLNARAQHFMGKGVVSCKTAEHYC